MSKRLNVRVSGVLYEKLANDADALECSINSLINIKLLNGYGLIDKPKPPNNTNVGPLYLPKHR